MPPSEIKIRNQQILLLQVLFTTTFSFWTLMGLLTNL